MACEFKRYVTIRAHRRVRIISPDGYTDFVLGPGVDIRIPDDYKLRRISTTHVKVEAVFEDYRGERDFIV